MSYLKSKYTQEYIRANQYVLAEVVIGSYAFNLHTPTSDRDVYGIYHLSKDDFYSLHYRSDKSYNEVVEKVHPKDQDITYMELGKFFELLGNGNPNVLEIVASFKEKKNVDYLSDLVSDIDINKVISKKCHKSFGEYAQTQIKKARGLNKKIVNPVDPERKTPIDFCYIMVDGQTRPLKWYLEKTGRNQKFCGVAALAHAKDSFALYYDWASYNLFGNPNLGKEEILKLKAKRKENGLSMGYGFKGIEMENSNEIRTSSIPKIDDLPREEQQWVEFVGYFNYNKDGYVRHCKDYREYWDWDEKRNEERYNNNLKQNYDTKNISHCVRLLTVAKEIAEGKGVILHRTDDRQFLMDIKLGKVEYDVAMEYAQKIADSLENLYKNSTLRDEPDFNYLNDKLIAIRKKIYA